MPSHTETQSTTGRTSVSRDGRSISGLLKELRDEGTLLFRQEIQLARREMTEKAARAGRNVGYLGAGGAVAWAGAVVLLLAASAGLHVGLIKAGLAFEVSIWLAPLAVGLVVTAVGYALIKQARRTLANEGAVPERTAASLREDRDWAREKFSS